MVIQKLVSTSGWKAVSVSAEARLAALERQLEREKQARHEAEKLAERGMRDLSVSRARIELLNGIALLANETEEPRDVLRIAVRDICNTLGYSFGNVFIVNPDEPRELHAAGIYHSAACDGTAAFVAASQEIKLARPAALPSSKGAGYAPCWTPGIDKTRGFMRATLARQANFKAMLTVPVLSGRDLLALLEFFSTDERQPALELLDVLMQVGLQIGGAFRRREQADRLRENALTDMLTGLPNRASFAMQIEQNFADCRLAGLLAPSLMFIDLDGFKLVNDTLGHHAGDRLLIEMANKLRDIVDITNAACPNNARQVDLARLAGDEFTLIVDGDNRIDLAEALATDIHAALRQPQWVESNPIRVTACIGIAHDDGHYDNVSAMLRDADLAMYEAKSRGSERTVTFDQKMRDNLESRLAMISGLREACERGGLLVHYQPILCLETERLVGFEALVRWERNGRLIPPSDFIPVAEESGVIVLVGKWVLREACRAAVRWNAQRVANDPLKISINVSPRQLLQPSFVQQVRDTLAETACHPSWISLEITETAAVMQPNRAISALEELRALDIQIGLDDFGTGHSSLSRLQSMPIDTIKIDQSFIRSQTEGAAQWSVVKAMLALAHSLELRVVVEGVETEFQRRELTSFGCEFAQGYLFSKPLNEDMADRLVALQPEGQLRHIEEKLLTPDQSK